MDNEKQKLVVALTYTQKNQTISFIMLFILTIGYIDKVYKSVSSKRKPTHSSVGNVFVVVYVCELDRDAGSPLLFPPSSPSSSLLLPVRTNSRPPALSALYKVKIYSFICLFLQKRNLL